MPATTKNFSIPYPTGGDPVRDAPQTFQDAVNIIDDWLKDPFIIVDGQRYPLSGMINIGNINYSSAGSGVYYASLKIAEPYTPPPGWRFEFFCGQSTAYTIVTTAQPASVSEYTVRVIQIASNANNALKKIGWRLVPESTDPNRLQGAH